MTPGVRRSNYIRHQDDDYLQASAANRAVPLQPFKSREVPLTPTGNDNEEESSPYENPDSRNRERYILHAQNHVPTGPHFLWPTRMPTGLSMGKLPNNNGSVHANLTGRFSGGPVLKRR